MRVLVFLVVSFVASPSFAQPPSQRLESDSVAVYPGFGSSFELLPLSAGRAHLRFEWAPHAMHSFFTEVGTGVDQPASTMVGYHLWPLGEGLEGLYLGPAVVASMAVVAAGCELGGQVAFGNFMLALGGGLFSVITDGPIHPLPTLRIAIGIVV